MSYIEKNLSKNEEIVFKAKLHWLNYLTTIGLFLNGLIFYFYLPSIGMVFFVFSLISYLKVRKTEIAITSSRIIKKTGIIGSNVSSINLNKIESVLFRQGILEKLFNSGTVTALGTGQGKIHFSSIHSPLEFKNSLEGSIG